MKQEQINLIIALWNSGDYTVKHVNRADTDNFLSALKTGDYERVISAWTNILSNPENDLDTDFIADVEVALDQELYNSQTLYAKA